MTGELNAQTSGDVELRQVRKAYGNVVALDDVSLRVGNGTFFSLLGPSGCGKTTTLRLIAGFAFPDAGDILIGGRSVSHLRPHRRNVNTVFQQYALFPHMTVAENVAFGLEMKGLKGKEVRGRVGEILDMVRLSGYEHRRPVHLSGGEQQRVALARALVNHPAILLLDEPLAALDLKLRRRMQEELKTLQQEVGITFLYVTHDQAEAMALSDRIAVMRGGRIQQIGTAEELYERPRNRFVADFIGTSNFLDGTIVERRGPLVKIALNGPDGDSPAAHVWSQEGADPVPDGRVSLSLRPERVLLRPATESPRLPNAYAGTVLDATYLGTEIQYRVQIENGATLLSVQPNHDTTQRYAPGASVLVEWAATDVRILEDEG